jgi:2-polyprenyl-3-methyl-5-hydroxy-6-metoxy-1,4-benzoquinol methylase
VNRNQALVYLARPGGRFLEIGCGSGAVLATLAAQFDELVGIELSTVRTDIARQGLAHLSNCHVYNEPLERLPEIFDTPFDCIVWADVLEHVVDVIEAMNILASLSRVGTQLVTTTPNVVFLPYRLRLLMGRGPNTAFSMYPNEGFAEDPVQTVLHDGGHFHYFTFRQVEILYQIAGFQPEQRLGFGQRLSRLRNYWPTLLSGTVCISGSYVGDEAA